MAKNNGMYYLIKEDIFEQDKEYFDFEEMTFSREMGKGVALSTIDALTTLFFDGDDLSSYIDNTPTIDRESGYKYYISYRPRKKENEKVLYAVWDDSLLNAISKITDGKIDFTHNNVFDFFTSVMGEIRNPESGLARSLINSKNPNTKLNDYNKGIVGVLASSSSTKQEPKEEDIMEAFSSYKEFRALYLGNKSYKRNTLSLAEQLRKIK